MKKTENGIELSDDELKKVSGGLFHNGKEMSDTSCCPDFICRDCGKTYFELHSTPVNADFYGGRIHRCTSSDRTTECYCCRHYDEFTGVCSC